jgi:sensor histidine kinase YesM
MQEYTFDFKKQFKVAVVVIPILGMLSTTPVYMVTGNDISILPLIWLFACLPLSFSWIMNHKLYGKIGHRPVVYFTVSIAIMVVLSAGMRLLFQNQLFAYLEIYKSPQIRNIPPIITSSMMAALDNVMIILFQTLARYRLTQVRMIQDLSEAQIQRMNAQYENLRNQIHPHFLFNALNTLKILIKKDQKQAETYIIKLSAFLRSSIESSTTSLFSIREDLNIAKNYLEIQEVRFPHGFTFECRIPEHLQDQLNVPILTFQSLFENALKHNQINAENPIHILVEIDENNTIHVSNTNIPLQGERADSTGVGLHNLNQRFKIIGGTEVNITQNSDKFCVSFKPLEK